jgi:uncharacterized repeat protein (TIGR03803 family)
MDKLSLRKQSCFAFLLCATTAIGLRAQTFTTLLSFDNADGNDPQGSLIQATTDGNFYGVTYGGGANSTCMFGRDSGCGTVFKINPSGALTTLYNFCSQKNCADGANPWLGLVQASDGNFYGTTQVGGAYYTSCMAEGIDSGCGTVFKITPSGTLTTLHSFDVADGAWPVSGLIQGTDRNLYGTTLSAGAHNNGGTVFKITLTGTLTTLYSFCSQSGCTDGADPYGTLLQASDGDFYGTTSAGGAHGDGTVFKITSSGTLTTLYSFCSQSSCGDGSDPQAGLIQATDGNFYGTTSAGGTSHYCSIDNGCGTVFKITPSGTLTTLYNFCSQNGCTDGSYSVTGLMQASDGNFYGTALTGGANSCISGGTNLGCGTVFKITSQGAFTTLRSFDGTDGSFPYGAPVQATDGRLYGTTNAGGASVSCTGGCGTVYSLPVSALSLAMHFDFDGEGTGTDYTIWRPSSGTWYVLPTNGGTSIETQWGKSGDIVVPGDYDGDGITDYAVWRPSAGTWYVILSSTGKSVSYAWGESTDVPVPGDYDGDGKTDYAMWRPSTGAWWVVYSSTGRTVSQQWGLSTDLPVLGDFDGDGKTDYAVWRPSDGTWYVILSSTGQHVSQQWGLSTDIPVTGDYDGDGRTDYAIWRPSSGTWYVIYSSTGQHVSQAFGLSTDIAVARDYDGDNKTDYAIWRPSTGTWWVIFSSTGKTVTTQWGLSTDVPVNKPTGE